MSDLAPTKKTKTRALYVQIPKGIQEEHRLLALEPNEEVKEKYRQGRPNKVVTRGLLKKKPRRIRCLRTNQRLMLKPDVTWLPKILYG